MKGSVFISGVTDGSLNFDGGNYHGELRVDLTFIQSAVKPPWLSIEDARIERDLNIERVSVKRVEPQRWIEQDPIEICATPLPFYPGWQLVEALYVYDNSRRAIVAFLWSSNGEVVLLSGESTPIHQLNERGQLTLQSASQVAAYLKFFCAYVWGDEGAFFIVESGRELDNLMCTPSISPDAIKPVDVKEQREGDKRSWRCTATLRYGTDLFRAEFSVPLDGSVEMDGDSPVADIKDSSPLTFAPPVRLFVSGDKAGDAHRARFWPPLICGDFVQAAPDIQKAAPELRSQIRAAANASAKIAGKAVISLRGLKAGALKYDPGVPPGAKGRPGSWAAGVELRLAGFEYERVEDENPTAQAFNEAGSAPAEARGIGAKLAAFRARLSRFRNASEVVAWRFPFLSRQYLAGQPAAAEEYFPQPYEHLARVLRRHGRAHEAREVTSRSSPSSTGGFTAGGFDRSSGPSRNASTAGCSLRRASSCFCWSGWVAPLPSISRTTADLESRSGLIAPTRSAGQRCTNPSWWLLPWRSIPGRRIRRGQSTSPS